MADRPEPASADDDELQVDLLSTETSSATTETAVGSTRNWPAIGLLTAAVVALSLWLVSTVISSPADPGVLEAPAGATTERPTTTTRPATTREVREASGAIEPIDPNSSLSLIYRGGGSLNILDFATGGIVSVARSGDPRLVVDDYLLINSGEDVKALALDDLGGEVIELPILPWNTIEASGRPNEVWGYEAGPGETRGLGLGPIARVDLATGEVQERLEPFDRGGFQFGQAGGWPDLITGTGGGVYERVDGGFVQRSDGTLSAADERFALVETCDAVYQCELNWLDRTSWAPIEGRSVPDDLSGYYSQLLGAGRILLYLSTADAGSFAVLDVTSGDLLRFAASFDGPEALAIGPEGRWVAFSSSEDTSLTIQTMDGSEIYALPDLGIVESMVIAELP